VPPRYIVDAMNVIGSRPDKWWNDPDRAMREFTTKVDAHAAATGKDITVVFDKEPGRLPATEHIDVVIARRRGRDAADYEIVQLVNDDGDSGSLCVVTSDKRLIDEIAQSGARVISAGRFRDELDAYVISE
jgi:predicted RNA-binding protein with PIN domain